MPFYVVFVNTSFWSTSFHRRKVNSLLFCQTLCSWRSQNPLLTPSHNGRRGWCSRCLRQWFVWSSYNGQNRIDQSICSRFHEDLSHYTRGWRFQVIGCLFGHDFSDRFAFLNSVAFFFVPFANGSLLHRDAESGHEAVCCHFRLPL